MNKQFKFRILTLMIAIGTLLSVAFVLSLGTQPFSETQSREPASDKQNSKLMKLKGHHHESGMAIKPKSLFRISLSAPKGKPVLPGSATELVAEVETKRDQDNVSFNWIIPPGIAVVSGELTGSLGTLKAQSPVYLRILIEPQTAANHQIHFQVHTPSRGGEKIVQVGQFNTLDIESMDQEQELELMQTVHGHTDKARLKFEIVQ